MRTDPTRLHGETVDVLVVGGGIQGAALAREAAARGLRAALVERGDFACGTSMRSSRLVHGGVRYLQQGHVALVREALAERERLLRLAPHLVRPLPLLMPFYPDSGGAPRWLMRLGLRLYSWLARRSTLPRPAHHAPADCLRLFPGLRSEGLRGGSLFWDARTEDLPLTFAVLGGAAAAGASLCNHVELAGVRGGAVLLRDRLTDRELELRATHVLNAAGPRADEVRRRLEIDGEPLVRTSRGSHLVLAPRDTETALGAFLPDGRIQFIVPHADGTLCGTTEVDGEAGDDEPGVPEVDVAYLLRALAFLLAEPPGRDDVRFGYCGWRTLPLGRGPAGALNREAFTVVERAACGRVHTVVGGKLTTHRSFAERCIAALGGDESPSPTRVLPLPGGDGPRDVGDPLWWRYGSRARAVRELIAARPDLGRPLAPDRPFVGAEVVYAVRELGAVTFQDVMLRRLFHTQGPSLDDDGLRAAHALYCGERGVSPSFAGDAADLRAAVAAMAGAAAPPRSEVAAR